MSHDKPLELNSERVNNRQKNRYLYLDSLYKNHLYLKELLSTKDVAKVALFMLYLAEGTKNIGRSTLVFGNSSPAVIRLFLKLLRNCYRIDEGKFRCTVQCRADQDTDFLKDFWSKITQIQPSQFYKARIDPRSVGKSSVKRGYKGVCRIDYLSATVYWDIIQGIKVFTEGP